MAIETVSSPSKDGDLNHSSVGLLDVFQGQRTADSCHAVRKNRNVTKHRACRAPGYHRQPQKIAVSDFVNGCKWSDESGKLERPD